MPLIRRTDGRNAALAAHGSWREMVNDPTVRGDELGVVVAEVDEVVDGDEVLDATAYAAEVARLNAIERPPDPPDPRAAEQDAIDAFAAGNDAKQLDATRAMAKRMASSG